MTENIEQKLILRFKEAKNEKEKLKNELQVAEKKLEIVKYELVEYLEGKGATSTSKYEHLGYIQIERPRLFASCLNENLEKLLAYLKKIERTDLIRTYVPPQTLSSFVSESIDEGRTIPDFVSYYLKPSVKLYE